RSRILRPSRLYLWCSLAPVNVDDQPIRIWQDEGRVLGEVIDFEHHARHIRLVLRDAYLLQQTVFNVVALANQLRREPAVVQVEEDAIGRGNSPGFVLYFVFEIDGDARVVRRGPVTEAGNARQSLLL